MQDLQKVPVLMYHSVGIPNPHWIWNFLTIHYMVFENHLRTLKSRGFNTIDLTQLYDYVGEGKPIPTNSIVMTFDDGYFDNWVFAYPLLKKYGFKGTIFINPEFVDPNEEYRPNLEDVWMGKVKEEGLIPHGFLSWRELREMEKSGVMDIQSHAMTHTWYFTGPEIVDFRHPGDPYVWMNWNKDISRKCKYLTENQDDLIDLATPVYKHEKSLAAKRYFPDSSLNETVIRYVKGNGGKDFFRNKSWQEQLFKFVENYKNRNRLKDGFESEEDQRERFEWELKESKTILERELNKKINFLCWPGGGYISISRTISSKYYISTTLASSDRTIRHNTPGEDPNDIKRMAVNFIEGRKGGSVKYLGGYYHYLCIRKFRGESERKFLRKLLKGLALLQYKYFR